MIYKVTMTLEVEIESDDAGNACKSATDNLKSGKYSADNLTGISAIKQE